MSAKVNSMNSRVHELRQYDGDAEDVMSDLLHDQSQTLDEMIEAVFFEANQYIAQRKAARVANDGSAKDKPSVLDEPIFLFDSV